MIAIKRGEEYAREVDLWTWVGFAVIWVIFHAVVPSPDHIYVIEIVKFTPDSGPICDIVKTVRSRYSSHPIV